MNKRTLQKLSEQILNNTQEEEQENKENGITIINNADMNNIVTCQEFSNQFMKHHHTRYRQTIIDVKKANALKIKEVQFRKQKELEDRVLGFQREKKELVLKYEGIIKQKDQYIRVLEELYCQPQHDNLDPPVQAPHQSTHTKYMISGSVPTSATTSQYNSNLKQIGTKVPNNQNYYLHQTPLYNQLCFSIQRPQGHKQSSLFSTQKIKNRVTSNEKKSIQNSMTNSCSKNTNRFYSTQRYNNVSQNNSRHGLTPACQPKYAKVV